MAFVGLEHLTIETSKGNISVLVFVHSEVFPSSPDDPPVTIHQFDFNIAGINFPVPCLGDLSSGVMPCDIGDAGELVKVGNVLTLKSKRDPGLAYSMGATGPSEAMIILGIYKDSEGKYAIPSGGYFFLSMGDEYIQRLPSENAWGMWGRPSFWYITLPSINIYYRGVALAEDVIKEAPPEDNDPYSPGGDSGTGGGTGSFTGGGSDVGVPGLPTLSAADTGFITLYTPSVAQLQSLANYMWSDLFSLDTFKKLFADPMSAIIGLSIVPVAVPTSGARALTVGNISTGVSINVASTQYVVVDCGYITLPEYWGAYLDYDPFTEIELFLPYIGAHAVKADDVMNKSVHVVYHVDILSGGCVAFVEIDGTVVYTFIGACSNSIPISGNSWTNTINGAIQIAGNIGSMVATGGASAPMALTSIAQAVVNDLKPQVEKSGSMSGPAGILGNQTPFFVLMRPRQALPARQNAYTGYPSFITENLGSLTGYTVVESIHLENIPCTEEELKEIEGLLKGGVIF